MSKKTILITGGCGFIGSNFVNYFVPKYKDEYNVINLDLMTYAAEETNVVEDVRNMNEYTLIKGDIRDTILIDKIFNENNIFGVIHFAAESHVDNSIKNPGEFITTNVNGTFNLVHAAYKKWMNGPHDLIEEYKGARFHHISTDEVFGDLDETGYFYEDTPYNPSSPYSSSKAGSDHIVRAYIRTYGMNCTVSNCSNNYGPLQHDEKLIPTVIRNALAGNPIPIYGTGENVRDWLYVQDHCTAIDAIYHNAKIGETYNVGGEQEKTNLDVCKTICTVLDQIKPKSEGSYADQITFVKDRAGHDFRYAINCDKIKKDLFWNQDEDFKSGMEKTINYYLKKYEE